MSVYATELNNIEHEMKRLRKRLKELRSLKHKPAEALYRYMVANNLQNYKGIKIEKVYTKTKIVKNCIKSLNTISGLVNSNKKEYIKTRRRKNLYFCRVCCLKP